MDNHLSINKNVCATIPAHINNTSTSNSDSGIFGGRKVSLLSGAGEAFCNLIAYLWDKITAVISYFTGQTLQDREIVQAANAENDLLSRQVNHEPSPSAASRIAEKNIIQLQEMASKASTPDQLRTLAAQLEGLDFEQLKRVLTVAVKDGSGITPMDLAAQDAACLQALEPLLSKLEPEQITQLLTAADVNGITPMHGVAQNVACLRVLEPLLSKLNPTQITQLLTVQNTSGRTTPMHWIALDAASLQALEPLLNKLDPEQIKLVMAQSDRGGRTPMHYVTQNGNAEGIRPLQGLMQRT